MTIDKFCKRVHNGSIGFIDNNNPSYGIYPLKDMTYRDVILLNMKNRPLKISAIEATSKSPTFMFVYNLKDEIIAVLENYEILFTKAKDFFVMGCEELYDGRRRWTVVLNKNSKINKYKTKTFITDYEEAVQIQEDKYLITTDGGWSFSMDY